MLFLAKKKGSMKNHQTFFEFCMLIISIHKYILMKIHQ